MRLTVILFLWLIVSGPLSAHNSEKSKAENLTNISESADSFSDSGVSSADSRAKDEAALVALYNATNGDNWDNRRGWSGSSMSLDDNIFGVEVEQINGELRVVMIRLNNNGTGDPKNYHHDRKGNNLTGSLPAELGNLKELRHFNVMGNSMTGPLPVGMRWCTKIERAYFEGPKDGSAFANGDWGEIHLPSEKRLSGNRGKWGNFGKWPHNNFSGSLPAEWADWKAIKFLAIGNTIIDENGNGTIEGITGPLPPEWGQWDTIIGIYMPHNKLQGKLPPEWAGMTELVDLMLDVNQLGNQTQGHADAQLPSAWGGGEGYGGGMRKLRHLTLNYTLSGGSSSQYFGGKWRNSFDGPIPENWGNMKMLHRLGLPRFNTQHDFPAFLNSGDYHNRVTSSNPDPNADPVEGWMSGLTEITDINNMTSIPDPAKLTYLSQFNAYKNPFNQQVPQNLNEWNRNKQFVVGGSGLTGPFPDLPDWDDCKIFDVQNNNFNSDLPELDVNGDEWRNVQAYNSNFTGSIPSSWNFPGSNGFFRLWLHGNNLSGPIPERLADPGHSYSDEFRVDRNRYVFADLVPFIKLGPNNFRYAPQQNFGSAKTYYLSEGESISLDDFTTVVTHSDNRYQWKKDGANISGATSRTLSFSSFSAADEGAYTLVVTNPGAPELTLTSKKITLAIGDGNDGGDGGDGGSDGSGGSQELSAPAQVQ